VHTIVEAAGHLMLSPVLQFFEANFAPCCESDVQTAI
jgi:hypothetical protein